MFYVNNNNVRSMNNTGQIFMFRIDWRCFTQNYFIFSALVNTKYDIIVFFLSHKQCQTFHLAAVLFRVMKTSEKLISSTMKCYKWIEISYRTLNYLVTMWTVWCAYCSHHLMCRQNMLLLFFPISCCEASCFIFLQTACSIHT